MSKLSDSSALRGARPVLAAMAALLCSNTVMAAPTTLVNVAANKCLDVKARSTTPGAVIQLYACNGGTNQLWDLTAASELRTFGGTRCLDVSGQRTAPGTVVSSYTCNGQQNQKWKINANGSITGTQSGLCLNITATNTATIATCSGNADQRWTQGGSGSTDTQSPTPPANPRTSNLSCDSVDLAWDASTDNVGVAFYDIYHDGQQMTTVGGSTLSARLTLVPGVTWGLYVNGRDAAGNVSQASATLSINVPQCTVDNQAPTTPGNLQGTVSGTSIALTWTASTDNVRVTAYDVFRNSVKVASTAAANYTDTGLTANTTYQYTVAARDAQANVSAQSTSISLKTGAACNSPICSVTQVTTDTDIPWGLATLPDGNILYNRRDAQDIILLNPTTGAKSTVGKVPNVQSTDGEGGLLGLAVTPAFPATDPWLYIYHTSPTDNRIVRIRYANGKIDTATLQILVSGIGRNKYHNGGRLRFGPDGKLYAATGDAQNGAFAQDTNNLAGKILRLNPDGTRPADNPFGNYVWSFGHRNPQGLAFDAQGRLWEQEFGNARMDETNLIVKGGNYGWPNCEGTLDAAGSGCATPGYIAPKMTYSNVEGSCSGIAIVNDVLYAACQRGARVYRHVISGSSLINSQQFFIGTYGRLRTIEPSRDGGLWMSTTNTGDKDSVANNSNEKIFKVILGN